MLAFAAIQAHAMQVQASQAHAGQAQAGQVQAAQAYGTRRHSRRIQPSSQLEHSVTAAVTSDPAPDPHDPARLVELTVPSHGAAINAVFYLASGAKPHPTVLLLHGFPGNEQNLDLAQAMRRAGFSVLTLHYRGAWGSPGAFSFTHAIEDTDAALAFLSEPAVVAKYNLDPRKTIVIGHSMGGFLALRAASTHPHLAGVAVLSAWNIGAEASRTKTAAEAAKQVAGFREELAPLAGCTAEGLAAEARANAAQWNYVSYADALKAMPTLVLEADDGLAGANQAIAQALRSDGNKHVVEQRMETDHSFSDHRIALERAVLTWLLAVPQTEAGLSRSDRLY